MSFSGSSNGIKKSSSIALANGLTKLRGKKELIMNSHQPVDKQRTDIV